MLKFLLHELKRALLEPQQHIQATTATAYDGYNSHSLAIIIVLV